MSPVDELRDEFLASREVRVFLERDDMIHPELPGNKWRKLKYNLEAARADGQRPVLTFGGAYSHHIRAVAAAGQEFGFATIGVIRGEEHLPLNPTLAYARSRGVTLTYLATYREKREPAVEEALRRRFGEFFRLPGEPPSLASVAGSEAFLDACQQVRGRWFTADEQELVWAASLWPVAHNARWDALHGRTSSPSTAALIEQATRRLARAGARPAGVGRA